MMTNNSTKTRKCSGKLSCSCSSSDTSCDTCKSGSKQWKINGGLAFENDKHLWNRYTVTVSQVMMTAVDLSIWWIQISHAEPLVA